MSLDPRSRPGPGFWRRDGGWADETPEAAYGRIDEAARLFLQRLIDMVGQEPIFLRSAGQPEDSVVVFDNLVKPFGVQLDPELEVVVVFDFSWQLEFGHLGGDRYADALLCVQERYGFSK